MRQTSPIRVSLIGAGHMGTLHAKKLRGIEGINFVGLWDIDAGRASVLAKQIGTKAFSSFDEAIGYSQAVILATPTETHGRMGLQVIERMRHLFIEKPIAANENEADILLNLAAECEVVLMVGHIENFNPAFVAARKFIKKPLFIESHRLTEFRGRSTDVSVIEDLMIHDIEILVNICGTEIAKIDASAAAVMTTSPDIANVRIRFDSGCVANLTASRLSLSPKRKMRIFQKNAYLGIDFDARTLQVVRPAGEKPNGDVISMGGFKLEVVHPDVPKYDPLEQELRHFFDAIRNEQPVNSEPALQALKIVKQIAEAL